MNWDFITNRLATGSGIVDDADVTELWTKGIRVIIDCRDDVNDAPVIAANAHAGDLLYLWNGVADDSVHDEAKILWIIRSLTFAMPLIARPGLKFYSHCQVGRNRGPTTAAAILLAFGISEAEARMMINIARPITNLGGIAYMDEAVEAVKRGW